MQTLLKTLHNEVMSWEGVTDKSHQFGGTEFNLGNVEIGHMHSNGLVDIPFTRKIREALVAENAAEPHHILPETGWISYYIRRESDVAGAIALMRLSYLHKNRRHMPNCLAEEIARLPFSDRVKQTVPQKQAEAQEE